MNCPKEEIRFAYLHDVVDALLPTAEAEAVRQHCSRCTLCQQWLARERGFDQALSRLALSEDQLEVDLLTAVQKQLTARRRWLKFALLFGFVAFSGLFCLLLALTTFSLLHFGLPKVIVNSVAVIVLLVDSMQVVTLYLQAMLPTFASLAKFIITIWLFILLPFLLRKMHSLPFGYAMEKGSRL